MIHGQLIRTYILSSVALSFSCVAALAQSAGVGGATAASSLRVPGTPAPRTAAPVLAVQPAFGGSVAQGTATATPIPLTLGDAIARGLKTNLGLLTSEQSGIEARAQRRQALSQLLPT